MNKLGINHLRVIKQFAKRKSAKISEVEKFLLNYVSPPTARKIIHQLDEFDLIEFTSDPND